MASDRHREIFLLAVSVSAAAAILLYRLTDFPLYFFCDEAVQGAEARSLLDTGRDRAGAEWPLFVRSHGSYQLSLSVYWLMPFQALLGASEFSVRLSHAVASLVGMAAAALFVRRLLSATPLWTMVPLVFVGAPFWYLLSRTGFEVVVSASAWLTCLAIFPALWKDRHGESSHAMRSAMPWLGFVVAFAFCFYSYTPARGWALLSVLVLVLAWWPVSRARWRRAALLAALIGAVVTPFLITAFLRPEVAFGRMLELLQHNQEVANGYRIDHSLQQLANILDPRYWGSRETRFESWERHMLPDRGLVPDYYFAFAAVGLWYCLREFRARPEARALLFLLPVGAFPAVLFEINPLRAIPVGLTYLLWACVGLAAAARFLSRWVEATRVHALVLSALLLQGVWLGFHVFGPALIGYRDYAFHGVQMGQKEVFGWIRANLDRYPLIHLTHAAFNGNEALVDFYLPGRDKQGVRVKHAEASCVVEQAQAEVWILRHERMMELERSECAIRIETLHTVRSPRGEKLFAAVLLTPLPDSRPAAEFPR